MRTPIAQPHHPDPAPAPSTGERDSPPPEVLESELFSLESPPLVEPDPAEDDLDRLEREIAALHVSRLRPLRELPAVKRKTVQEPIPPWVRRVDPELLPPPPARPRRPPTFGFYARMGVVALLASVAALFAFGRISLDGLRNVRAEVSRLASAIPWPKALASKSQAPAVAPTPALVLEGSTTESGDAILLGVKVNGRADGAVAVITGLVPGTTLTAGHPSGPDGWLLPAADLQNAFIRPPQGFAGTMQYAIELHVADGSLVDRQSMILEWPESAPAVPAAAPRQIDSDELALLLKRGQSLIETGDLAAARLILKRAAESGNARAAFALAATYDPLVLKEIGALGFAPDVAMARAWYEKAKEFGSREAPRRLELLASQSR